MEKLNTTCGIARRIRKHKDTLKVCSHKKFKKKRNRKCQSGYKRHEGPKENISHKCSTGKKRKWKNYKYIG